jgi:death-on-curing protein
MFDLTVEDVIDIHDRILNISGGLTGMRDLGLLESALNKPNTSVFTREIYKGDFSKAAAILEAIALFHPFNDGNKRAIL